jgi:casein kinase II subunit alpha
MIKSINIPRLYGGVVKERALWDYENYQIRYGIQDDYEVMNKLGRGKYSEVFTGLNVVSEENVVIKMLKYNAPKKH